MGQFFLSACWILEAWTLGILLWESWHCQLQHLPYEKTKQLRHITNIQTNTFIKNNCFLMYRPIFFENQDGGSNFEPPPPNSYNPQNPQIANAQIYTTVDKIFWSTLYLQCVPCYLALWVATVKLNNPPWYIWRYLRGPFIVGHIKSLLTKHFQIFCVHWGICSTTAAQKLSKSPATICIVAKL